MNIFVENVDGISAHKYPDLLKSSSSDEYGVIALTETWLDSTINSAEFMDGSYNVFRKDRCDSSESESASRGGGVLLAIRSNIPCDEYTNDQMNDLESICVRVPLPTGFIYIYNLYIRPSVMLEKYRSHILAIEQLVTTVNRNYIILLTGDFNFGDTTNWMQKDDGFDFLPLIGDSQSAKAIIARETSTRLLNAGLFQMCNYKNASGNVLDLIYTNCPELSLVNKADICLQPSNESDIYHNPLVCTLECSPVCLPDGESDPIFCFRKANYDKIREHLNGINILDSIRATDVNDMLDGLYQIIYETFDKFVPKASLRFSNKPKWHNKQLSHLKNIRNKRYKDLCNQRISTMSPDDQVFIEAKREYENYGKQLFEDFLREKASESKTNPKSFWKHIKDKRTAHKPPNTMSYGDSQATTDVEKAHLFAEYFKTVYTIHEPDNELHDFIDNRCDSNFFKLTVRNEMVYSVLSTLNINKGSGHGGISALFLRE